MLQLSTSLTFANVDHPSKSRPWEWLIKPDIIPYWYKPNYLGLVSYTVWALIIPITIYIIFRAVKKKDSVGTFSAAWFLSTYGVYIPLALITDRVTYVFYFYPTVGAICLAIGYGISRLLDFARRLTRKKLRWLIYSGVGVYLLGHLGVFLLASPTGLWFHVPW